MTTGRNNGADTVTAMMDLGVLAGREEHTPGLRLSQAGKCARQSAYALHGVEKDSTIEPRLLRIFEMGDAIHDQLRRALVEAGASGRIPVTKDTEFEVTLRVYDKDNDEHLEISGHPDGVVVVTTPHEQIREEAVLEIKSVNPTAWSYRLKDGPDKYWISQASCYAAALGVGWICIVAYNKGTSDIVAWLLPRDDVLVAEAERRWLRAASSTPDCLPARDHQPGPERVGRNYSSRKVYPWECRYCDYRARCLDGLAVEDGRKMVAITGEPPKPAEPEIGWDKVGEVMGGS